MFVLSFLLVVAYVPFIPSGAYAPRWALLVCVAPMLMMYLPRMQWTTGHTFGAMALACAMLSLLWSFSPYDTVGVLVQTAALACFFVYAAEQSSLQPMWQGLGWGMVANLPFVILQLLGWHSGVDHYGVGGLLLNRDIIAAVACFALFGLLGYAMRRSDVLPVLACLFITLFTASRGAWLTVAAVLAFLFLRKINWISRISFACALILTVAVLLYLDSADLARNDSMRNRLIFWDWTTTNLTLFGWGYGSYDEVFKYGHAHNDYLELLFELGLGVVPFALLVLRALEAPFCNAKCVLLAIGVQCFFSYPLHTPVTAFIAAMVLGWLCGARHCVQQLEHGGGSAHSVAAAYGALAWGKGNVRGALQNSHLVPVGSNGAGSARRIPFCVQRIGEAT